MGMMTRRNGRRRSAGTDLLTPAVVVGFGSLTALYTIQNAPYAALAAGSTPIFIQLLLGILVLTLLLLAADRITTRRNPF